MSIFDRIFKREDTELKESFDKVIEQNNDLARENAIVISELEELKESIYDNVASRDVGWTTQSLITSTNTDFDIENHKKMIEQAVKAFFFSPAGKRMVRYVTSYITGSGFKTYSQNKSVQFMLDEIIKNPGNKFGRFLTELVNRIQIAGESFVTIHFGQDGSCLLREISPGEITEILTDPEDISKPIVYQRDYVKAYYSDGVKVDHNMTEYIPACGVYKEDIKKLNFGPDKMAKLAKEKEIYHVKVPTFSDRKRGLSDFSAILLYLGQYRKLMENKLKSDKIKDAFYLDVTVDGGSAEVTAEANKSQYRRPPKSGSTLFHNKGVEVDIKQPNTNHADQNKQFDPVLRQIVMGSGMPEWMIVGMANMFKAGAQEQSAPFVKLIEDYQELWRSSLISIFSYVIKRRLDVAGDRFILAGSTRRRSMMAGIDKNYEIPVMTIDDDGNMVQEVDEFGNKVFQPFWESIEITFPEIITRDEQKEADALMKDIASDLVSRRTASTKRGYDYDQEKKLINLEKKERMENDPFSDMLPDEDTEDDADENDNDNDNDDSVDGEEN